MGFFTGVGVLVGVVTGLFHLIGMLLPYMIAVAIYEDNKKKD